MGNKKDELEIRIRAGDFDLMPITETWWDMSHDWDVLQLEFIEYCPGADEERVESLWVSVESQG